MTDTIEEVRTTEAGNFLMVVKVGKYGISADLPNAPESVECCGRASIELDVDQARKLVKDLQEFIYSKAER